MPHRCLLFPSLSWHRDFLGYLHLFVLSVLCPRGPPSRAEELQNDQGGCCSVSEGGGWEARSERWLGVSSCRALWTCEDFVLILANVETVWSVWSRGVIRSDMHLNFFFSLFIYFEREKQSKQRRSREREGERERESQAASTLSAWSLMWGSSPQTMGS